MTCRRPAPLRPATRERQNARGRLCGRGSAAPHVGNSPARRAPKKVRGAACGGGHIVSGRIYGRSSGCCAPHSFRSAGREHLLIERRRASRPERGAARSHNPTACRVWCCRGLVACSRRQRYLNAPVPGVKTDQYTTTTQCPFVRFVRYCFGAMRPQNVDDGVFSIEIVTEIHPVEGELWPAHVHERHELLSAVSRSVTVLSERRVHVVPRGSAIWIPAGCEHAARAVAGNVMRCTWFMSEAVPDALRQTTMLASSPLLDAVLVHIDGDLTDASRRNAEAFALDLLTIGVRADAGLPQPTTAWLRSVTDRLADSPDDGRTVAEWATFASVSTRTFSRRFLAETGMRFGEWRTRLRMQTAMAFLQTGAPVAVVARRVGFDSPAAFTTAFRRVVGVAPSDFVRGAEHVDPLV